MAAALRLDSLRSSHPIQVMMLMLMLTDTLLPPSLPPPFAVFALFCCALQTAPFMILTHHTTTATPATCCDVADIYLSVYNTYYMCIYISI